MKKIYLSFCLITTIISLSCMEQEQQRIIPVYTLTTAYQTNNQYPLQPSLCCEANQPGWQQLNKIMDASYHSNHPVYQNGIELEPIYNRANTTIVQQEKKPLLQTNYMQPNTTIMQELYEKAARIIAAEYDGSKYNQWAISHALVNLITTMNNAKNNGISEDLTGEFAYKKKEKWHTYRHHTGWYNCVLLDVNIAPLVPLVFTLLKKYNATIHQTGEQIPLHFVPYTYKNHNTPFFDTTNVGNDIIQYSAFFQFHYTLRRAITEISFDKIKTFLTYLYENNDISQEGSSDGSYKNLNNEFYTTAYNYLLNEKSLNNLYSLLQIISKAKELREIHDENDLVVYINSVNKPTKGQIFGWFSSSHSDDNVKNRITLLCKEIKKYNKARDYKLTPTIAQYYTYYVKRFINIPLPENTYNSAHLDETFYAFEEFEQLRNDTTILIELSADEVNEQYAHFK